jgi:hypothetical protein
MRENPTSCLHIILKSLPTVRRISSTSPAELTVSGQARSRLSFCCTRVWI